MRITAAFSEIRTMVTLLENVGKRRVSALFVCVVEMRATCVGVCSGVRGFC